jgi:hydrogenase-4 component B
VTAVAWLAPLLVPLLVAPVPFVMRPGRGPAWLLALAPTPALLLALLGPPGPPPDLAWLLFDVQLDLDPVGRLLLAMTAAVWIAAGASVRRDVGPGFAGLWLVTLTGNLTLLLAGDVVTLYGGFAVMTFAAYGLVVHDRSAAALRAGRVYVVLAAVGEVLLLSGLLLAVAEAGSTSFDPVVSAIGASGRRDLIVGLVLAGFGIKAGVVPLHVWLPLAHPAAPIPASAVLSGTMIKAGLVGWLRVLPLGEVALPTWSAVLIATGLVGAFLAVVVGLLQDDPKVVLAYSSISQMGLITVIVGAGVAVPEVAGAAGLAAAIHALHHGVAKGALFLGVGVARAPHDAGRHRWVLAGMAFAAASLAGAPLTSGWVAKATAKEVVGAVGVPVAGLSLVLSVAGVGTTVLLARMLWLLRRPAAREHGVVGSATGPRAVRGAAGPTIAWVALLGVVLVGAWVLPLALVPGLGGPTVSSASVWEGTWPVVVGVAVAAAAVARSRRPVAPSTAAARYRLPAGDLVVPAERAAGWAASQVTRLAPLLAGAGRVVRLVRAAAYLAVLPGQGLDRVDRWLTRWRTVGASFALTGAALAFALWSGTT